MSKKNNNDEENLRNAAVSGASAEVIQRYGSAVKEHIVAKTGINNETGQIQTKSLDSIYKEKVHPDYEFQNTRAQAGFAAEVKETARTNAENIINGSPVRKVRTDDIGRVNDPVYDHVELDAKGNEIDGSGSQMKFVGSSERDPTRIHDADRILNKLQSKKYEEKYLNRDIKIVVPSDQYEKVLSCADVEIAKAEKQLAHAQSVNDQNQIEAQQQKINKLKNIKNKLQKSKVSADEAVEARTDPTLSTAKDILKVSHRAGIEAAKGAAMVGGTVSMVTNIVALCKGEKTAEDAVVSVAKDTAVSAAVGYGSGFVGSAIKGAMQNAGSSTVRTLSKTNLPAVLVSTAITTGKTLTRYFKGEIDGVQCFETLGVEGAGMVSSAMFAAVGQIAIPIPVVGAAIGSMIGYALATSSYSILKDALNEAKLAHERRLEIEKACAEHIAQIKQYRAELTAFTNQYFEDKYDAIDNAFLHLKRSLSIDNIDGFIEAANSITKDSGDKPLFSNFKEFKEMMKNSDEIIF